MGTSEELAEERRSWKKIYNHKDKEGKKENNDPKTKREK